MTPFFQKPVDSITIHRLFEADRNEILTSPAWQINSIYLFLTEFFLVLIKSDLHFPIRRKQDSRLLVWRKRMFPFFKKFLCGLKEHCWFEYGCP